MTVFIIAAFFVATLVRSALGFGEALIAVPLVAFVLPVEIAAPVAVPRSRCGDKAPTSCTAIGWPGCLV